MNDWENAKCLLCGSAAISHVFVDARGQKYDECEGGCPPYAVNGWTHEHIRLFIKPEGKAKIVEFLKAQFAKTEHPEQFVEITPDDLRNLRLIT